MAPDNEISESLYNYLGAGSNPHLLRRRGAYPNGRDSFVWTGPAGGMYRPLPGRPRGPNAKESGNGR